MICFVLHGPSEQLFSFGLEPFSFHVLRANRALHCACDVLAEVRQAQASLTVRLLAFLLQDFGIDDYHLRVSILFERAVDDRNSFGKDRKSTRLNSSHLGISYAVFCLK